MRSSQKLNKSSILTYKANYVFNESSSGKTMAQKLREKIHFQKTQKKSETQKFLRKDTNIRTSSKNSKFDCQQRLHISSSTSIGNHRCFKNSYEMAPKLQYRPCEEKSNFQRSQSKIKQAYKKIDELLLKINREKNNLMQQSLRNSPPQKKIMVKSSINTNNSQNEEIQGSKMEQNLMWEIMNVKNSLQVQNPYVQDSSQFKMEEEFLTKNELDELPTVLYRGIPTSCTVCLEQIRYGDQATYMVCLHFAHPKCCQDWLSRSTKCPLCQINIKKQLNE